MQLLEQLLIEETQAQARYYQDQVGGASEAVWTDLLRGPSPTPTLETLDTLSIQSAPVTAATGATAAGSQDGSWRLRHKRTQSSCLPTANDDVGLGSGSRPVSSPPGSPPLVVAASHGSSPTAAAASPSVGLASQHHNHHHRSVSLHATPPPVSLSRAASSPHYSRSSLATSPSIASYTSFRGHPTNLSSSNPSLRGSHQSLMPQTPPPIRPASLYVPFVGCVDAPRPPPGQAAREVLNALSYAPTGESYNIGGEIVGVDAVNGRETATSPLLSPRLRRKTSKKLAVVPASPKLKSKSNSLASLMGGGPASPRPSHYSQFDFSTRAASSLAGGRTGSSPLPPYSSSPLPPPFSPSSTSPSSFLNHSENSPLKVTHPPVIHPPPDLVQMITRESFPSLAGHGGSGSATSLPLLFSGSPLSEHHTPLASIKENSPYRN